MLGWVMGILDLQWAKRRRPRALKPPAHSPTLYISTQHQSPCFRPKKGPISLEVLICRYLKKCLNFHSEAPEIKSSQYHLFFSIIKHAGLQKLQGLEH